MDWLSVTRLLVEGGAPAVVVDRELRVALVNAAFEHLLGVAREDLEGAPLEDTRFGRALAPLVTRTLQSAGDRGRCRVPGPGGIPIELELDAVRVGEEHVAFVLLVVRASHETLARSLRGDFVEYAVGGTLLAFGELRVVTRARSVTRYWTREPRRCHLEIYGAHAPCADCPVIRLARQGSDSGTFCAPRREPGPERIATVERRDGLVHVRVEPVAEDITGPMLDELVGRLISGRTNR